MNIKYYKSELDGRVYEGIQVSVDNCREICHWAGGFYACNSSGRVMGIILNPHFENAEFVALDNWVIMDPDGMAEGAPNNGFLDTYIELPIEFNPLMKWS